MKAWRHLAAATLVAALIGLASEPALAERRVALIVGNANYQFAPKLRTPPSDADHVAELLRRLDFQVVEVKDVDKPAMEQALRRFAEDISGADVALFYYSGHGVQVADDNYILPVSARVDNQRNLALDTYAVMSINEMMRAAGAKVQLLFLDACRNNPFGDRFASTRSIHVQGLAAEQPAGGALLAFSAGPGQVALDGEGDVSPFTQGFLKFGATPNLEVRQLMARVRGFVSDETSQGQIPWDNSSLLQDVYLVPSRAPPMFEQLTRAHLPAEGFGTLHLMRPAAPDGGAIKVRIEQAPASGKLELDGRPIAAGAELDAAVMDRLAYRASGVPEADSFSYRVSDDWGHSNVGFVSVDFSGDAGLVAETPQKPINVALNGVSLIGLGPNLQLHEPMPTVTRSAVLRLQDDPAYGQFRIGDRVIGKDRTVTVAELPRLAFLPPVGVEGQSVAARFVGAQGSAGEVDLRVKIDVTECDRLAGDRFDIQGVTTGVYPGRIDLDAALPACELAARLQPKSGRFVYELARVYAGLGRDADAAAAYKKAADLGHVRALWALGYRALYLRPTDEAKGVALLEQARAAGDIEADHTLGQAYYEGRGVAKDLVKARKLFEKAAEAGFTFSMNSLGRMYQRGETVDVDLALTKRYWEESAARGDIYGLNNLGYVYQDGVGVAKDPVKAMDYFKQASNLGHPEAPNNVGRLYLFGIGVAKDPVEARRWYELGMSRGDAWAAFNLGELTRDGVGGAPDKAKAGYYFARAAAAYNRPEPSALGRKALAGLDAATKLATLRLLTAELDPSASRATDAALPALARNAAAAHDVAPTGSSTDDLMVAVGQAIFAAKGARTDLF